VPSPGEIQVPTELRRPHPVVAATRDAASGLKPDETARLDVGRRPGVLYLHVSRAQLRRALLIANAILAEAERRGYTVEGVNKAYDHRAGIAINVRGHAYAFEIHEMTDREPLDAKAVERWRRDNRYRLSYQPDLEPPLKHIPNGRLRLSLPDYAVKRANWTEGPRGPLEAKLTSVFTELERRADADDLRDVERDRWLAERERQAEIAREQARLAALEQARVERLKSEVERWRLAKDAREYAAALREQSARFPGAAAEIQEWCDWIDAWTRRMNPLEQIASFPDSVTLEREEADTSPPREPVDRR
jgi:hypothetical protein